MKVSHSMTCVVATAWLALGTANPVAHDGENNVTYAGTRRNGVEAFLGIPYGQDTSGQHRFRPPRPYPPKPGSVVNATALGPACAQDESSALGFPPPKSISEDCLNLNVVRPNGTKEGDGHAVVVWIYGGGLRTGHAQDVYSVPDDLVAQSVENGTPVIHVAMNYRLGIFGFAQSDALRREGSENAGLRDQRLALEWVRDNVEHFGGDPGRITIFGQSSGGLSVGIQMLAYGGGVAVPFQQAMCESQALETSITSNVTFNAFRDVVEHLDIKSDVHSGDTIAALRGLDTTTLLNASIATYTTSVMDGDIWLPAVDGDFIPAAPSELIASHRFASGVTAIIGWCQDDENLLTDTSITTADDTRRTIADFAFGLSADNVDKLLDLYPSSDFLPGTQLSAEFYRAARIKRDIVMTCQPLHYARHLAAAGNRVYLYNWNQTLFDKALHALGEPEGLGVVHLSDIPYWLGYADVDVVFPQLPPLATEEDFKLADRASRSFSTFATLGQPGLGGRDTFQGFVPAFDDDDNVDIFIAGGPNEGMTRMDGPGAQEVMSVQRLRERCGFLNSPEIIEQLLY